jgi:DNA mismatch repair protein MutS2
MRAAVRLRRFLTTRRNLAPTLAAESESLSDFEPLAAEIERAITPDGLVSDLASPLLADLRERCRGLHRAVKQRIDAMLRDLDLEEVLRDKYYTIRDNRYVVPVVSSHKARLPGIVHNASQSGQTLFVEPDQLVDLGNQLTIAEAMAEEEERRILRELTEAVGRRADELLGDVGRLAELDRLGAMARLSDRLDAAPAQLAPPTGRFELKGLRHPLLVLRGVPVVASDVALAPGKHGLVVSGPNAGGKTVTLTAVGLCALMTRAGMPVPAAPGSIVPLYARVFTAIGDEGDLSKDLSTFTAHLTALRDIVAETIPGTLVCIDEMAADTDPREGAAIATAVLEELMDRGANVLVTTHLDEVKARSVTDPRLAAASVGFDFEKLAPTYRLVMNVVGASSAIEIARRVGLSAKVCERSRQLLGGAGGALGQAVTQLERERSEVRRLERVLDEERQRLVQAREEWDRQRRLLAQKERELEAGLRGEVVREVERARADVRDAVSRLQGATRLQEVDRERQRLDALQKTQAQAEAKARAEAEAIRKREAAETPAAALAVGARVKVAQLGEGEIIALEGDQALVALGALKLRVDRKELVGLLGKTTNVARIKRSEGEKAEALEKVKPASAVTGSGRIDLRGRRTEDALRDLRTLLDAEARGDAREVVVVHGHGTGALKQAVREELDSSPYVASFRRGEAHEGGDGVTLVTLAG